MAAKQAGCIGGMIAVVFTSVVAPVLVAVITQHLKSGDGKAGPAEPGDKGGTVARPAAQPPPAPRLGQAAPGFLVTAAPEQARPPAGRSGPAIAGTAAAVPLERERPQAPHAAPTTRLPQPGKPDAVFAEGIGPTPEAALQDAFRNAVRQALGSLVDAGTLVRNDRILADRVLKQSASFIRHYEEISSEQEKRQGREVYHKKIAATVERPALAARLKAANIKVGPGH